MTEKTFTPGELKVMAETGIASVEDVKRMASLLAEQGDRRLVDTNYLRAEGVEMFALMYAEEAIKDGSDNTDWKSRASSAASEYAAQLRNKSEVQS